MSADDNNILTLLMLGGGVAAASALAQRVASHRSEASIAPSSDWIYPVPSLDDRFAVVSNPFRAHASDDGKLTQHLGVDLMYRRRDARDVTAVFPSGTAGGTRMFFMPDGVPALAAAAGVVTFANWTPVGNTVVIRHSNGWGTYYTHLATLAVRAGQLVSAGQVLGTIGASPEDAAQLRHLHFELWKSARRSDAVDPAPYLAAWSRVSAPWSPTLGASVRSTPRNGALSAYRPVGDRGEAYPPWLRALKGQAGVYVIRDVDTHEILYVGSSAGRLYDTLTRHLQVWRRWKGFWKGQYGEGADPGLTYPRSAVEVAVRLTSPSDALDEEMRLIARLRPRDNQIGQPEAVDEHVPF